jgi:cytochrome c5
MVGLDVRDRLRSSLRLTLAAIALASVSVAALAQQPPTAPAAPVLIYAQKNWDAQRETFYTTSQGSHMMPLSYFKALRLDNGDLFAADQLARYGYLRNDSPTNKNNLPVGFVIDGNSGQLGMTCAACHTGQIEYQKDGVAYALRIDGAPAGADFQQFLTDLTAAARATLADPKRFDAFAKDALGSGYGPAAAARLKQDFTAWVTQFGAFMDASLPDSPWGPGRLDAFGMIFNRVAARDLGVDKNFRKADAPVSYPFLWNASRQDHTQWPGIVPNGLFIQGLARNTGEVFGVFADFKPKVLIWPELLPPVVSFKNNSADFSGLQTLEEAIASLPSPAWPRDISPIDDQLAAKGEALFASHCAECHAERKSPEVPHAWATPVRAVGTDPKMATNAQRTSDPGIYAATLLPPPAIGARFVNPANASDILATSVVGSLLDNAFSGPITPAKLAQNGVWRAIRKDLADLAPNENLETLVDPQRGTLDDLRAQIKARLNNLFKKPASADAGAAYESRVLYGIWATAPYLHNGSVPNLWELLLPAKQRTTSFSVGSRKFDWEKVGYVTTETPFKTGTFTVDASNGNGNGGHEYGTDLSDDDRRALIEYLKKL